MSLAFPKTDSTRATILKRTRREAALDQARDAVWRRDGYQCRICCRPVSRNGLGPIERRGEVHHLIPRSRSKALRADTKNLILLCKICHQDAQAYRLIIKGNADGGLRWERV